jgi:Ran GTPase-activating protein (RanGAP) involved in mRNA processing and transport
MENMPQLQSFCCTAGAINIFRAEGVRAFQPALRANRTLKELDLFSCQLGDGSIRFLVHGGLVGTTTMDTLDIRANRFFFSEP